jgi:hypothetical protein
MSNKVFIIFIAALLGIGIWLGHLLANRPTFSVNKLLNVVGILYSMTAVIVLYETVAHNHTLRSLSVDYLAPVILWSHSVVPLGIALSWFLTFGAPHGGAVSSFGFSFFFYSLLPLSLLDSTVVFPRVNKWKPIDGRHRRFGLFLLFSGLGIQFVAAILSI